MNTPDNHGTAKALRGHIQVAESGTDVATEIGVQTPMQLSIGVVVLVQARRLGLSRPVEKWTTCAG